MELSNCFLCEMYVAILKMNPNQNEAHIVRSKFLIVKEHVKSVLFADKKNLLNFFLVIIFHTPDFC